MSTKTQIKTWIRSAPDPAEGTNRINTAIAGLGFPAGSAPAVLAGFLNAPPDIETGWSYPGAPAAPPAPTPTPTPTPAPPAHPRKNAFWRYMDDLGAHTPWGPKEEGEQH